MTVRVYRGRDGLSFHGRPGDVLVHLITVPAGSEVLDTKLLGPMLFVSGLGRDFRCRTGYEPAALVRAAQDRHPMFRFTNTRIDTFGSKR